MIVATQDEWIQFVVTSSYISCTTRESDVPPARHTFGKVQGYMYTLSSPAVPFRSVTYAFKILVGDSACETAVSDDQRMTRVLPESCC